MKHSLIVLLLLASPGFTADQPAAENVLSLSLNRAVQLAISPEGNAQIQISGESLKQAQARSSQVRAALLPDVSSSLAYRNQTINLGANGLSFDIPTIPGFSFAFPSLVGPFSVMDARISATQSVFDISSIRRLQAAHSGISAARFDTDSAAENVAAQVARAYLSAIRADADVETAKANLTLSQALLKQAENQKGAGTGTGIEITRVRVQLANNQQQLIVAENARHRAYLQLLRFMNLPLDTRLLLTDKLGYIPVDAVTLENAKARALAERPDLKAQQEREVNTRISASAIKLERIPSLSVYGDYGSIGSGFDNALPTRVVGMTLRVPIFDGGRRDYRRVEAASQFRAEKVRTKELKEQIELDVRLALDDLHSAEEQVKVARDGLQLSENELAQARRRYEAGVAFGLEVTDAQTRLERARDNETEALYNYNLARIDLEQAMGGVRSSVR
ncbi:MAG TPA: TolC family protein [Acidobacteriota bacterium]|nr:TolC family protein [Acidobacteriota bacterium]